MAELTKNWDDAGSLTVAYEGSGDGSAVFSSDTAEGLDRSMVVSFVDKARTVVVERTVKQTGLRERFMASDGGFLIADGGTFNVLKPPPYTEVGFIENANADAYIDTGYMPNERTRLVLDLSYHGSGGNNIAGVRDSASDTVNRFGLVTFGSAEMMGGFFGSASIQCIPYDTERHVFELDRTGMTVDGTAYGSEMSNTFECAYSLLLLAWSNGAGGVQINRSRVYSCQIYEDDVLVRDFIPAVCEGTAGLWDKVSGTFFAPQGGGTFDTDRLPDGYTELEYLQGDGTGYIVTDFYPSYATKIVTDLSDVGASNQFLYGVRDSYSQNSTNQFDFYRNNGSGTIRADYFGTSVSVRLSAVTERTTIVQNRNNTTAWGKTLTNTAKTSGRCTNPLYIFALDNVGTAHSYVSDCKLYSMQIYDADALVRDFVPCTDASGAKGLYCRVQKKFYKFE